MNPSSPRRRFPVRLVSLIVILLLIAVPAWQLFRTAPAPLFTPGEERALQKAAHALVTELQELRTDASLRIAVVPLAKDPHGQATTGLVNALARHKGWQLEESSRFRQLATEVTAALSDWTTVERLARAAAPDGVDLLISGKVLDVTGGDQLARARIEFQVYDWKRGQWLVRREFTGEWRPSLLERTQTWLASIPRPFVWAAWALIVLVLPWLTTPLTRAAVRRRSNLASFALVLGHTVVALLLAGLLLRFGLQGLLDWALFLALLLGCAGYAWWACEKQAADIIEAGPAA